MVTDVAEDEHGPAPTRGEARRAAIERAAIDVFSARGFRRASMAHIAEAAGVSRPALYQYFGDKDELFASAFVALFNRAVDAALAALDDPGTTADQLDGFLQRYEGDLWEQMSASPHVDELIAAKNQEVSLAVGAVIERLWQGLGVYLERLVPGRSGAVRARRTHWADLLRLSPQGFRSDQPPVDAFRQRLTALATAVAADIEADGGNHGVG